MADPLTLSVMSQIVRKAGGKDPHPDPTPEIHSVGQPHLTDRQAVLLSELIHKKKTAASSVQPSASSQRKQGTMSLDALVRSTKTR